MKAVFRALGAFVMLSTLAASADDGMWMPQQIPVLGEELKKLGLQIDPNQFADLTGFPMGAIVAINGCSASFVSPDGLLVTNHHCVAGALQFNSTPENDILRNGFLARERGQEIQATPDARVWVTTAIEDVTKQILAPFPARTTDADRSRIVSRRRRGMIHQCEKPGSLRCPGASFFAGAQYQKITQMRSATSVWSTPRPSAWATSATRSITGCGRGTPATSPSIAPTSAKTASPRTFRRTTFRIVRSTTSRCRRAISIPTIWS